MQSATIQVVRQRNILMAQRTPVRSRPSTESVTMRSSHMIRARSNVLWYIAASEIVESRCYWIRGKLNRRDECLCHTIGRKDALSPPDAFCIVNNERCAEFPFFFWRTVVFYVLCCNKDILSIVFWRFVANCKCGFHYLWPGQSELLVAIYKLFTVRYIGWDIYYCYHTVSSSQHPCPPCHVLHEAFNTSLLCISGQ